MQPNLELKTQPKQLLGSLPLIIALPVLALYSIKSGATIDYKVLVNIYEFGDFEKSFFGTRVC
jgi:hypothetical protein